MNARGLDITMQLICQIPPGPYGRITGITQWHDEIFVATEFGAILRLIIREDGTGDYAEVPICVNPK